MHNKPMVNQPSSSPSSSVPTTQKPLDEILVFIDQPETKCFNHHHHNTDSEYAYHQQHVVADDNEEDDEFYLRYHMGQRGRHGPEFLEFELFPGGKLRYVNSSSSSPYNGDHEANVIQRELYLSPGVVDEIKRMVRASTDLDDSQWDEPFSNGGGIQELEVKIGRHHLSFATTESNHDLHRYARSHNHNPLPHQQKHDNNARRVVSKAAPPASADMEGLQTFYTIVSDLKALIMALIACHFKQRPFG